MMITSEVRGNQLFSTEDGMWRRPFEASASSMGPVPVGVPGRVLVVGQGRRQLVT